MKYTKEEAFEEIKRRGRALKIRHEKRVATVMSAFAGLAAISLILAIGVLGGANAGVESGSAYGSFLLSTQAGGYVLAAVVAFAFGVGTTLMIQKVRKNRADKDKTA